ncbi:MAG TPA: hypothetical protein VK470_12120, partial [Bacteroidota bacterium]|nr:hypothetical protein [Bacteroidota bacterium]
MKTTVLAVLFCITIARAEDTTIPDYATTPRKDIPTHLTWNNNDLFPSIDAWKKEKDEMVRMMGTIPELRKNWTASAAGIAALYECTDA